MLSYLKKEKFPFLFIFLVTVIVATAIISQFQNYISFNPPTILLAQVGGGTTYYACDCGTGAAGGCAVGNDTNAGTSPSSPLRTYDALQGKMTGSSCGTQFLFCQGGSFPVAGATSWAWSGTTDCSSNPKIVGSYSAGFSSARPKITKTGGGHVFDVGATPSQSGLTIRDLEIVCDDAFEVGCNGGSGAGVGVYLASAARVTLENLIIDNFTIGLQTAGYTPAPPSYTLRNSTIKNSQEFGILGHVGDNTQVLDSTFDNNTRCRGSECGFNRTFYISPNGYSNFTFARNTVNNWGSDQDAGGACNSNAGHIRGGINVLVEDNIFSAKTSPAPLSVCSGIRIYGFTDAETHVCQNCTVRRNRFYNTVPSAISLGSWNGGIVENNIISAPSYGGTVPKQGIVLEPKQPAGGATDADMTGVTIRNNSIYLEDGGANTYTGVNLMTPEGSGYVLTNNAVQLAGTSANARCFSVSSGAGTRISTENNNICSTSSSGRYISNGGTGQTLSAWRSATSLGTNSQEGLPGFTSPSAPSFDFRLLTNALSINAGHATLSATEDVSKASRPQGGGYDVGAYESGSGGGGGSLCGNGVVESGEQCDGSNLNGQSCTTQGFTGGTLSCSASCTTFVTSACTNTPAPDSTPPTVTASAPSTGTVGTALTLSATASDNVGVAGVQFRINGANQGSEDTSSPYSISYTPTSAGTYTVTAVARDTSNLTTTSNSVNITVTTTPPTQTCNNNIREGTEVCDGTALNGQSCTTQGFTGGTLSCSASCTTFVTSACTGGPATITTLIFEPRVEGRSAVGQTFSFVMRNETLNTQVGTVTIATNAQGQVTLTGQNHSASHTYSFTITANNFLRRVMRNVTLSAAPLIMPTLLAGDLNTVPDQIINSLDWSIMSNQWGSNNTLSDINRDGVVNSIDFAYLNKNWMLTGE